MPKKPKGQRIITALKHDKARRPNIPTAEMQSLAEQIEEKAPLPPVHYPRARPLPKGEVRDRDQDLDPQIVWNGVRIRLSPEQVRQLQERGEVEVGDAQLVWHGKDRQDWSDLVVQAPPLYIQEKVHPKALMDDLVRHSKANADTKSDAPDLFADFNGIPLDARTDFYQHAAYWSNRMILGDSLYGMASLATREGLKGKVQCIYIDPPYGIKFNSNWQVSTQSRDVKDGKREDISREPEQVKAFRDTWKHGVHSYLTYLRDRLTVARELLTESGSIFVQIGDENVHRVRAVMDETFGAENFVVQIVFRKKAAQKGDFVEETNDFILYYAKAKEACKFHHLFLDRDADDDAEFSSDLTGGGVFTTQIFPFHFREGTYRPAANNSWKTNATGMERIAAADRMKVGDGQIRYRRFHRDYPYTVLTNTWSDTGGAVDRKYIVQTTQKAIQRCLLMATDPGDLVLDPTCGSGTTAFVAEQWGRRWITIDTSRVALALARALIMGARYPYYYLADTPDGRLKEAEVTGKPPSSAPTQNDIRQGFVYERAPHVTLKSIANNAEIDVIWEEYQTNLEALRSHLNKGLGKSWEEWEIPREADEKWPASLRTAHAAWWELRIARHKKIDESIARNADVELLYDRPYIDSSKVRVAGPFTVESLSPHRVVPADDEELSDALKASQGKRRRTRLMAPPTDFAEMVLENLRTAGVQQIAKGDAIKFTALQPWPGEYVAAEGTFLEGGEEAGSTGGATGKARTQRRAAIFLGPEFGTVSRLDLVAAAREASEARFDVLIACAFNYDAHASELSRLGPLPVIKAKMNPDLHMADELKNTGKGNLFVVFGEPDIDIETLRDGSLQVRVKGIDVFDPNTGEVRSNDTKGIAAWFIDTDYDHENFFVRHAYFLGANDPYKSLKTALKAEIDEDAWATLYRDTSRPFPRPESGRIAVKVINHFGDEVMKVFGV